MGSAGRFLAGLLNEAHARGDKARDEQSKARDMEVDMYKKAAEAALQAGKLDQAQIALQKIDQLYKLPKGKSPFGKLGEFLTKVGNRGQEGGKEGTPNADQGNPAPQADGGGAGGGQAGQPVSPDAQGGKTSLPPLGGGAGAEAQAAQPSGQPAGGSSGPGPGPGKVTGKSVTRAFEKAARGLGGGISAIDSAINRGSQEGGSRGLPPLDAKAFPAGGGKEKKLSDYTGEDGKKHIVMQRADSSTYEIDSDGKVQPAGSKFPRVLPPLSMSKAQELAKAGDQYLGQDGTPLDLGKYDQSMQLVPVLAGGKVWYEPTSQGVAHLTVGNEVYAVPKLDMANLGSEGTALGQARTGTERLPGYVGVGDDNKIERVPGVATPATPGASGLPPLSGGKATAGPPPATSGTPVPTRDGSMQPLPPASKRTATDLGKPGSKAAKSGAVGKSLPVPVSLWNQQQQIARPVREGATQVFGDPTQPSLKSLKDYANLADDPDASKEIATALKITFDSWEREIKQAGSLSSMVETAGGVPQLLSQLQANVREDAIGKLKSEDARDYYDSVMSSYGAIVGLRSLTKASAAQFSVTAIERELPLVGLNSFTTRQYYDQLSRLAEQVYNGTRTMVDQVMPASDKEYYKNQVEALGKLRDSKSRELPGKPPASDKVLNLDPAGLYQ